MSRYMQGMPLIQRLVFDLFPLVNDEIARWKEYATKIPNDTLRREALASIETKKFHCQGGSAYALYPLASKTETVGFIVAFQTISDYLDNLCDRAGVMDEAAFRQLHLAMTDAIEPDEEMRDYYSLYLYQDDGGYLNELVQACRAQVRKLPSFSIVQQHMKRLIRYYAELQSLKHIDVSMREERLLCWSGPLAKKFADLKAWEFCAAAGSTLGVFVLFAAAQQSDLTHEEADSIFGAYFPWVCALHIQLDYFIDAEEDEREGDFNFTWYYSDESACADRLVLLEKRSIASCARLRYSGFHKTIIRGLLAMYLSDVKASSVKNRRGAKRLVRHGGAPTVLYFQICKLIRRKHKL